MAATTAQQPQQGQQQKPPSDQDLIALIIAAFLAWHTAAQIVAALRAPFRRAGISGQALRAAVGLVLMMPQPVMEGTGPATRWAVRQNTLRRAAFSLSTCKRVQAVIDDAKAHGEPVMAAIENALTAEQRYFSQHVAASQGRIAASAHVDGMASVYGDLLGWQAITDKRCTPGCRRASGSNFRASQPPVVEGHPAYPGMVHGATCRCMVVKPFPGAPLLPSGGDRGR